MNQECLDNNFWQNFWFQTKCKGKYGLINDLANWLLHAKISTSTDLGVFKTHQIESRFLFLAIAI